MTSVTQQVATAGEHWHSAVVFRMAALALTTHLLSTELHECTHLIVGRLAGLPAHFLAATSVGVSTSVAQSASPAALAWMNGVAPLLTMLLGVLALFAAPALRGKGFSILADFCAWWAIFGVPYIGLQTMVTAAPINVRGNGADFAAVIGGYFGVGVTVRAAIAIFGFVVFLASGYWLRQAVISDSGISSLALGIVNRLREVAWWRLVLAFCVGLMLIYRTARDAGMMAAGNVRGLFSLAYVEPFLWAATMMLIVKWNRPGPRFIRNQWIFPGLLASALLIGIGWLTNSDFLGEGMWLTIPLLTTAWSASALRI